MEANGPRWHALRDGLVHFPSNSPSILVSLICLLMSPDPNDRPSAQLCLQNFTELKTPLEIELEKQKLKASKLEYELQQLLQAKHSTE